MEKTLNGKTIAILATDGFEQVELTEPKIALEEAGAETRIVSPAEGEIKGWKQTEWGDRFPVDVALDQANTEEFDGLLLPGGVINPDKLRMNPKAMQFVRSFFDAGKPIAAICHGPWSLVEIGAVAGRTVTSWPSLKTDILNAGGNWVDQEVVTDNGIVTSRKPDDIPAFNQKMIEEFAEGSHAGRRDTAHTPETHEGDPAGRLGMSESSRPSESGSERMGAAFQSSEHIGRELSRPDEQSAIPNGSEAAHSFSPRD